MYVGRNAPMIISKATYMNTTEILHVRYYQYCIFYIALKYLYYYIMIYMLHTICHLCNQKTFHFANSASKCNKYIRLLSRLRLLKRKQTHLFCSICRIMLCTNIVLPFICSITCHSTISLYIS